MEETTEPATQKRPVYDDKIELRCYKHERENALENARLAGFRFLSAYIRHRCFFDPVTGEAHDQPKRKPSKKMPLATMDELAKMTRELNAIGNNLNQLATLAHTDRIPNADRYEARLEEGVFELQTCVATIMKYVGGT